MPMELLPEWMAGLEEEDVAFIKRFILASGSLKEVAGQYGVTYPTVRLRPCGSVTGIPLLTLTGTYI